MGARARQGILLDQAKTSALAYLATLPQDDRVMLVRADALATPVTAFESDKAKIERAIRQSQPGASALNLEQALEFAQRSQQLQSQRAGEIVFSGAGRISADEAAQIQAPRNLRALLVPSAGENVGLRKLGVRQSPTQPDSWEAFVAVRNDGLRARDTQVELRLAGSIVGAQDADPCSRRRSREYVHFPQAACRDPRSASALAQAGEAIRSRRTILPPSIFLSIRKFVFWCIPISPTC